MAYIITFTYAFLFELNVFIPTILLDKMKDKQLPLQLFRLIQTNKEAQTYCFIFYAFKFKIYYFRFLI